MNGPTGRSASERSRLVADGQKSQKDLGSWGCSWWSSCNDFSGVPITCLWGCEDIAKFVPFFVLCLHKFPILPNTSALTGGTSANKTAQVKSKTVSRIHQVWQADPRTAHMEYVVGVFLGLHTFAC